jgi:hypothetical protein
MSERNWMAAGLLTGICLLGLAPELALAGNKFEIIGGGVVGSNTDKMQYVRWFGIGFGCFFLLAGIVSLTSSHGNGLMLNYVVWKKAGIIWLILSALSFGLAVYTFF